MNDRIAWTLVNARPTPIRLSPIDVRTTDWSVWKDSSSLYVDGRRYEAPDGVPVELQPKLAIAATRCGAELAGAVDQVNGPSSREERASVANGPVVPPTPARQATAAYPSGAGPCAIRPAKTGYPTHGPNEACG
jgi:hypothetical protein